MLCSRDQHNKWYTKVSAVEYMRHELETILPDVIKRVEAFNNQSSIMAIRFGDGRTVEFRKNKQGHWFETRTRIGDK